VSRLRATSPSSVKCPARRPDRPRLRPGYHFDVGESPPKRRGKSLSPSFWKHRYSPQETVSTTQTRNG
jgi:hypothetical protein